MNRTVGWLVWLALLTLMTACQKAPDANVAQSLVREAGPRSALPFGRGGLAPRYVAGEAWIDDCQGLSGVGQKCYWFHRFNRNECGSRGRPCDKLVVFYAGGEQSCPQAVNDESGYGQLAKDYADDGYVFACAQLFEDSTGAGMVPFHREADRVHRLQVEITSKLRAANIWNGRRLLIAGVSHGGTAPVIAMKHTGYDQTAFWKGTVKTGACFFDGSSDMYYTDSWFDRSPSCQTFRDRVFCERYGFGGGCEVGARTEDRDRDTISSPVVRAFRASASDFAIRDWKLVECGSARTVGKCLLINDVLPAVPQQRLCQIIGGAPGYRCSFESHPSVGHASCTDTNTRGACRRWFNGLR
jgi:hypothetical protein